MYQKDFPENLIKGRIAETIFELMFREGTDFDIYPLGYEHTTPILRQYRDQTNHAHKDILNKVLDNFDDAPDFILAKPDKSLLYTVEVKFRHDYHKSEILEIATEINKRWHPVKIFLANHERFYYSSCVDIIRYAGVIEPLKETLISEPIQNFYHKLLMRFEK